MHSNTFDRISFFSLLLVVVLLPIFFLPFVNIPVETSKGLLLVLGLCISIIFWAVARFFDGTITLPKSPVLWGSLGVVLAVLLSALFSGTVSVSLFGTLLDMGSFWFIFTGFLFLFMSSIVFQNRENARVLLLGIIFSSAIVLVFQGLRLFSPDLLSLGILSGKTGNLVGSWNAFGLFAGFTVLMSILVVEFFPTTRTISLISKALILLGIVMVAVVNFPLVWALLGISGLIIFVYKISVISSQRKQEEGAATGEKKFPTFSFIIVMVSLLFFMSGQFIGGFLPSRLGITNTEVSPSLGATMTVGKGVLAKDPVFGIGPNKFGEAWALYKPRVINETLFWNVAFTSGSGLLPTYLATGGYLGILAWLAFFVLFLLGGIKSVFSSIKNNTNSEMVAFFVLSLYLFISSFFYSAGPVLFLSALALAGVFLGLSSTNRENGQVSVFFLNDHRKSFFSIMLLILLIIVSAALSFKYMQRLISVSYFNQALSAQSVEAAQTAIGQALSLHSNDLYLRAYSQIYLLRLNSLVAKGADLTDAEKAELQTSFDQAVGGAQLATQYNAQNYLNFQLVGSIYQTAGSLGVADAYPKAIEAYQAAVGLNPLNPELKLQMATTSLADKKLADAKAYANEALSLKGNYVDALLVLSQIARSEGDNAAAISYAERALAISPTNEALIEYVDSLKGTTRGAPVTPTAPATPEEGAE